MDFTERLQEIRARMAAQNREWERLRSLLEAHGDAEIQISYELLDELTSAPNPQLSSEPFRGSIRA